MSRIGGISVTSGGVSKLRLSRMLHVTHALNETSFIVTRLMHNSTKCGNWKPQWIRGVNGSCSLRVPMFHARVSGCFVRHSLVTKGCSAYNARIHGMSAWDTSTTSAYYHTQHRLTTYTQRIHRTWTGQHTPTHQ